METSDSTLFSIIYLKKSSRSILPEEVHILEEEDSKLYKFHFDLITIARRNQGIIFLDPPSTNPGKGHHMTTHLEEAHLSIQA